MTSKGKSDEDCDGCKERSDEALRTLRLLSSLSLANTAASFARRSAWNKKRNETQADGKHSKKREGEDEEDLLDKRTEEEENYDAAIDEIVSFGQLNFLHIATDGVEDVTRLLTSRLLGSRNLALSPCLVSAWRTYGELIMSAEQEKRNR